MEEKLKQGDFNALHYCQLDGDSEVGILLLHPISLNLKWITQMMNLFANQGFKVWGCDLPGHGKSKGKKGVPVLEELPYLGKLFQAMDFELEEASCSILDLAQELKQKEGLQYLIGGGFSLGGLILGFVLSQDKGNLFDAAFLQCYANSPEDVQLYEGNVSLTSGLVRTLGAAPIPLFVKSSQSLESYFKNPKLSVKWLNWIFKDWMEDEQAVVWATKKTLLSFHFAPSLADPEIPILLLKPENDQLFGDHPQQLVRRLNRAEILTIADAGHGVFLNKKQDGLKPEISKKIGDWIKSKLKI